MSETIEQRRGEFLVAEGLHPLPKGETVWMPRRRGDRYPRLLRAA